MRHFRLILPLWALLAFLAVFLIAELPRLLSGDDNPELSRPARYVLFSGALAYGFHRVTSVHPFYQQGYRQWLESTPWNSRKPLPLGWPGPSWPDAAVLAMLWGLALIEPTADPAALIRATVLAAAFALVATFRRIGIRGYSSAALLLAGLSIKLTPEPWWGLGAALAAYGVAALGLRRSLALFPWSPSPVKSPYSSPSSQNAQAGWNGNLGWPHAQLSPIRPDPVSLQPGDAFSISLVLGWWLFAIQGLFSNPGEGAGYATQFALYGISASCILRYLHYRRGFAPPLGLLARIGTHRLVIPSYDQMYLGPTLTALSGMALLILIRLQGIGEGVAAPVAFAGALLVALTMPPSLERWRLTGGHRVTFPSPKSEGEYTRAG